MQGPVHVTIGKKGLTTEVLEEIRYQLKNIKIVKIKFLGYTDREEFRQEVEALSHLLNLKVWSIRGRVIVCSKNS